MSARSTRVPRPITRVFIVLSNTESRRQLLCDPRRSSRSHRPITPGRSRGGGPLDEHVARADRLPEVDDGAVAPVVIVVVAELAEAPALQNADGPRCRARPWSERAWARGLLSARTMPPLLCHPRAVGVSSGSVFWNLLGTLPRRPARGEEGRGLIERRGRDSNPSLLWWIPPAQQ